MADEKIAFGQRFYSVQLYECIKRISSQTFLSHGIICLFFFLVEDHLNGELLEFVCFFFFFNQIILNLVTSRGGD